MAGADVGALVFLRFEFGVGVFEAEGDGLSIGLVGVDFDRDGVGLVGIEAFGEGEGRDAVVGAVAVESWDRFGVGFAVDSDDDLSAIGSKEVVEFGRGTFELEGDFCARFGGVPDGSHAVAERFPEACVGRELFPFGREHGGIEGDHFGGLPVVFDEGVFELGGVVDRF